MILMPRHSPLASFQWRRKWLASAPVSVAMDLSTEIQKYYSAPFCWEETCYFFYGKFLCFAKDFFIVSYSFDNSLHQIVSTSQFFQITIINSEYMAIFSEKNLIFTQGVKNICIFCLVLIQKTVWWGDVAEMFLSLQFSIGENVHWTNFVIKI